MKIKSLRILFSVLLLAVAVICNAKSKNVVWEKPTSSSIDGLVVTRVEMKPDETVLNIRYDGYGSKILFVKETYLLVDGKRYLVTKVEGLTLGEGFDVPDDHKAEFVFHFSPLPLDTKEIELHEGDGDRAFVIYNIGKPEWIEKKLQSQLFPSVWRNMNSGDCELGLFDEFVVYDYQFWNYKSKDAKKCHFVVTNGKDEMTIDMSKVKNGMRQISINGSKADLFACVSSKEYPKYPVKDMNPHFKNNDYREDSVTIIGYIGGVKKPMTFNLVYNLSFKSVVEQDVLVDSLGRFKVMVSCEEGVNELYFRGSFFPVEPGETYFYYENPMSGQRLFMGNNGRLQNEWLVLYQHLANVIEMPGYLCENVESDEELMKRKVDVEFYLGKARHRLDSLLSLYPDVSVRAENYVKTYVTYIYGDRLVSFIDIIERPLEIMDFIRDEIWAKRNMEFACAAQQYYNHRAYLNHEFWQRMPKTIRIWEESEEDYRKQWMMLHINKYKEVVDSLCTDSMSKSLLMAEKLYDVIEDNVHALPDEGLKIVDEYITVPGLKELVLNKSASLENLGKRELNCIAGYVDAESLDGITDGETLLAKIIEPYKGRLVYMDIWGTWCVPCKNALSKSDKLKEALKDYDIVYMYLANGSPENAWKDVINAYGLTDVNSVHYNLPAEQQKAIEKFLGVSAFPTYKLFDKEGRLVDANVSPRDLKVLKSVIEKVK